MLEFLDDVRQPSCLAATCMAGQAVLPGLVAMGVEIKGGVQWLIPTPPAFPWVVSPVGHLWSRGFPILGEIMTMDYITVFNRQIFPFQHRCWEPHGLSLFKEILRKFDVIKKLVGVHNDSPCYVVAHLRGVCLLVLHAEGVAQNF